MIPWILITMVLIGLVILGLLIAMIVFYRKSKMPPTDYYAFFVMGIIWVGFGIVSMLFGEYVNSFFFIAGLAFAAIGLANKKHWKRNHRTWAQLTEREKKFKMVIFIILGVLVLLGLIAFLAASIRS